MLNLPRTTWAASRRGFLVGAAATSMVRVDASAAEDTGIRLRHGEQPPSVDRSRAVSTAMFPALGEDAAIAAALREAAARGVPCILGNHRVGSDVLVPAGLTVLCTGTISGTGQKIIVHGAATKLIDLQGVNVTIEIAYDAVDCEIWSPRVRNALFGLRYAYGYGKAPLRCDVLGAPIFENCQYGMLIEGSRECEFHRPIAKDCGRSFVNYVGARSIWYRPRSLGKPILAFTYLATRSVTGAARCFGNTIFEPDIENFSEEGISFDCRGNTAHDSSAILTTRVSSADRTGLKPVRPVADATGFGVTFQTGKLAGRCYECLGQAGGTLRLGDNWAADFAGAMPGDFWTLEIICRDNVTIRPTVRSDGTSRSGILLWGWGRETTIQGGAVIGADMLVKALRGLISEEVDYGVPHHVTIDGIRVEGGDIRIDNQTYSRQSATTVGATVVNASARTLIADRQADVTVAGDRFEAVKSFQAFTKSGAPLR